MSEESVSVLQAADVVKSAAKRTRRQLDIFDSIKPDVNNQNNGQRITELCEDELAFKVDDPFESHRKAPLVIRDDPRYRQYLQTKKKPTPSEIQQIEFLEKYVGRIFYYYKTNYDLENNIVSDMIVQTNTIVPHSPMRRYVIPSAIPVAVPRWIIIFLRLQCVNNICAFEKRDPEVLAREMEMAKSASVPFVDESVFVVRQGESLIKVMALPEMPKSLIG